MCLTFNFPFSRLPGKAGDCHKYSTWQSQLEGVLRGILQRSGWVCRVSVLSWTILNFKSAVIKQRDPTQPVPTRPEPLLWLSPADGFLGLVPCKHQVWSALALYPDWNPEQEHLNNSAARSSKSGGLALSATGPRWTWENSETWEAAIKGFLFVSYGPVSTKK